MTTSRWAAADRAGETAAAGGRVDRVEARAAPHAGGDVADVVRAGDVEARLVLDVEAQPAKVVSVPSLGGFWSESVSVAESIA